MLRPRYNQKEPQVFLLVMPLFVVVLNLLYFGPCVFTSVPSFLFSFVFNGAYVSLAYYAFGSAALLIRNRYAASSALFRRIAVMLPVFWGMNLLMMGGLLLLHTTIAPLDCPIYPEMYWWTVLFGCIFSTVLTFVNEGLANWQKWKSSLAENEQLRNAYERSRLLGLKGQINPHFLFNCFNTLSGLIQEGEEEAERFLEEMTRVHRYLLRSDEALLVPVAEEVRFANAYLYLAKTRFGKAIEATIKVSAAAEHRLLPSHSLQAILENIIYSNALSKGDPLLIEIRDLAPDHLCIRHSLHQKTIAVRFDEEEGLDNLLTKYRLLNAEPIHIDEAEGERMIILPLLHKEEAI
jgi:two-component system LytT family sensor kinase